MIVTNHPLINQRVRLTGEGWVQMGKTFRILTVGAGEDVVLFDTNEHWGGSRVIPGIVTINEPGHPFAGEIVRTIYGSRSRNVGPLPWADGHTDAAGNPRRFAEPYHVDGDGTDCRWCVTEYRPRPEYDAAPIHPVNPILAEFRAITRGASRVDLVARSYLDLGMVDRLEAYEGVPVTPEHVEHARRVIARLAAL